MVGLAILAVLLLIAAAAPRYGYDSRVGVTPGGGAPSTISRAAQGAEQAWSARRPVSRGGRRSGDGDHLGL